MRFDLEIVIQEEEIEFDISIRKINLETVDRIFKFTNNSIFYLTNFREVIENSNEGQIELKFINRTNTKIYALQFKSSYKYSLLINVNNNSTNYQSK